jgi:hypothetical protein
MATMHMVEFPNGTEFGPADEATLKQWAREGRIRPDAQIVDAAGGSPPIAAASHPLIAAIVNAPPTVAQPIGSSTDSRAPALIPYKNPAALVGYYLSVFSLIPVVGAFLGLAAVGCGIAGRRAYRRDRRHGGAAHAWVAIILGSLTSLVNWGILIAAIAGR